MRLVIDPTAQPYGWPQARDEARRALSLGFEVELCVSPVPPGPAPRHPLPWSRPLQGSAAGGAVLLFLEAFWW